MANLVVKGLSLGLQIFSASQTSNDWDPVALNEASIPNHTHEGQVK